VVDQCLDDRDLDDLLMLDQQIPTRFSSMGQDNCPGYEDKDGENGLKLLSHDGVAFLPFWHQPSNPHFSRVLAKNAKYQVK
jgi:hypothetical protein